MPNQATFAELKCLFPKQVNLSHAIRQTHGQDEGCHAAQLPDAVFFARSTNGVVAAVKICAAHRTPIIPYGAGTSLEGHITAPHGGLSIDLSQMNNILSFNPEDMDIRVEAGVTRKSLNQYLRDQGMFFPVDPGADATIGGMVATRASGTNAVKYGTMREQLLSLKVVTATGEVIETGTRARKSAAGYDLTHLYAGSEGTLGIITEVVLRLHGIPEKTIAVTCCFPNEKSAVDTVTRVKQVGLNISRIELLDTASITAVNAYAKTSHSETATLFVEFGGSPTEVTAQSEMFTSIAKDYGGQNIKFADNHESINELWHARHQLYYAVRALAPGKASITTDVCVPISRLASCIEETQADIAASGLQAGLLGHVGDGNFHTIILYDDTNAKESKTVQFLADRMAKRAIEMEGTCSGEHGIGIGKRDYLEWERGNAVTIMRQLKTALDPSGIMNPGKIFND